MKHKMAQGFEEVEYVAEEVEYVAGRNRSRRSHKAEACRQAARDLVNAAKVFELAAAAESLPTLDYAGKEAVKLIVSQATDSVRATTAMLDSRASS